MMRTIEEYLDALREKLRGSDPALIQDALADAEEYLRNTFEAERETSPKIKESEALPSIIAKYGSPEETASAYREIEERLSPQAFEATPRKSRPSAFRFFQILSDRSAWGAFVYMIFSISGLITGLWTGTGLILSFITPIALIILPSIRGIALLEGRIVEALLGLRMPRRPFFFERGLRLTQKYRVLVSDSVTWKSAAYLVLQLPIGLIYFSTILILFAASAKFILYPILAVFFDRALITIGGSGIDAPAWAFPLITAAGIILLSATLHLARGAGRLHGRWAKHMLVKKIEDASPFSS